MRRGRGRRYDTEPKLNMKKVIAVIVFLAVVIMFGIVIKNLLTKTKDTDKIETISYYTIYTNEKWGVIDSKANTIIEPTYDEMIVIPDSRKDIFVCMYDVDYQTGTYQTKVLNAKGEEKFSGYELVEYIDNMDSQNNLWYEENVLKIKQNGTYGLINLDGKVILEPEYDEITSLSGIKGSLLLKKGDSYGVCDTQGSIQVEPEYKQIKAIGKNYKDGYIVENQEGKYGVVDFTKKVILEPKYTDIKPIYEEGKYIVKEDKTYQVVNKEGATILENKADKIQSMNGENFIIKENSKYGVINSAGEQVLPVQYENLQYAFSNYYIAKQNGKYGVIDTEGNNKIDFIYSNLQYRKEEGILEASKETGAESDLYNTSFELKLTGIINQVDTQKGYMKVRVGEEYQYYNFKFEPKTAQELLTQNTLFLSKKDGKYGYVDKDGNVKVDYQYEDAIEQNASGYVAVKKDGLWGSLDKTGAVAQEPSYALTNNLKVDFIGKWHIAEDLNAYYYTDK